MTDFATYAFEGDQVIAFHGNHVIAKGTDFEKVSCTAEEYFDSLRNEREHKSAVEVRKTATHVTTPNGTKGTILGRTSSIFSNAITVRFENGEIRHYDTFVGDGLKFSHEEPDAPKSPVEYFQRHLDAAYVPGREGLIARLKTLDEVKRGASHLASQNVSYVDGQLLHQIVLASDAERLEVAEALDYLVAADAEAMAPPKMAYSAVEQADLGRSDSWLEIVANEMVAEAESQDFDKLLSEGPTEFVSSLETGTLAHTGTVRDMAIENIHGKTSGFQGDAVEQYRDQYVANVELARKRELTYRNDVAAETVKKEASVAHDVSDEALYL